MNTVPEYAYAWVPNGTTNSDGTLNGTYSTLPHFTVNIDGVNYTGVSNRAYDVNDAGYVVGMASYPTKVTSPAISIEQVIVTHAYVFNLNSPSSGLFDLGVASGTVNSLAKGINNKGEVVVQSNSHLFLTAYNSSTLQHDLGTFSGQYTVAADINDGLVATGSKTQITGWNINPTTGYAQSFVWTQTIGGTGTTAWIPNLDATNLPEQEARGINNHGAVVGVAYRRDVSSGLRIGACGFVWDPTNGIRSLPLEEALSINDSGKITGWYKDIYGKLHSSLLTPVP